MFHDTVLVALAHFVKIVNYERKSFRALAPGLDVAFSSLEMASILDGAEPFVSLKQRWRD